MEIRQRVMAGFAAAIILAGVMLFVFSHRPNPLSSGMTTEEENPPPVAAGDRAADFRLVGLDGKTVSMADFRGKVVFLNVWATWCGPCREEMPSMESLYDDFKGNKDFVMLAVSQDTKGKDVVLPYVQKNGYHFNILLDPENKVGEAYNVAGVPETFIIGRDGRIVAHHMGAFDWSRPDVRQALQDLLAAKKG